MKRNSQVFKVRDSRPEKFLKRLKFSELPVEQPTPVELLINLKTAKQTGVTIQPNVLAQRTGGSNDRGQKSEVSKSSALSPLLSALSCIGALLFALCSSADAQQAKRIPQIGYLSASVRAVHAPSFEAFQQGLRELGYVEGNNISIEARFAEGKAERLPDLVTELVQLKVDVILAGGSEAVRPAKQATTTIPIVVAHFEDPIGEGYVASLARPGGNITGLSRMSSDLAGKRLQLLKEAVPTVRRVGIFLNPANQTNLLAVKEADGAARGLGLQVQRLEVRRPDELEAAFAMVTKERSDALIPSVDRIFDTQRMRIIDFASKNRLPTMFHASRTVQEGGLMSYAPNVLDLFRRSATYVDKILKGAKPADLPVEQPTKFEFVVNTKSAKQIGLTIPPNVLARADRVIK
jgi:putative ABC transport system substrate-binding protein